VPWEWALVAQLAEAFNVPAGRLWESARAPVTPSELFHTA
jgi:hypothetical protein